MRDYITLVVLVMGLALWAADSTEDGRADLSGAWTGAGWGQVMIKGDAGTYTDTYGTGPGTFRFGKTGEQTYAGTWRESEQRHGRMWFTVLEDGRTIYGLCVADDDCRIAPGSRDAYFLTRQDKAVQPTAVVDADSVVVTRVPGNAPGATEAVLWMVEGPDFEKIRKDVEKVVSALGTGTKWSDFGPDASYLSAEINLAGKRYTIRSWHPLHKDKETVAVSEKWGLMAVSGKQEKAKIEGQNSDRYRTLVSIFGLCRQGTPQPAPAGDPATRDAPEK